MLSLVDYGDSDSEGQSDGAEYESCVHAEVIANPKKGFNVIAAERKIEDGHYTDRTDGEEADSATNAFEPVLSGCGVLASLPSAASSGKYADNAKIGEEELEELVGRKQWELKLAKKAERKRRKKEKKAKKLGKSAKNDDVAKKKTKIDAFGGLMGLDDYSDDESEDKKKKRKEVADLKVTSNGLLSMLPQPKSHRMSNEAFFKSPKEKTMVAEEDSDDSDVDPSDFFGLRSNSEVPLSDHQPTVVSDVSYGPTRPPDLHYQNPVEGRYAQVEELPSTSEGPSTCGVIDDTEAQRMIYSHDVAAWGGTEATAAAAVENIVDVSVDQALGPNVQANLLKNLHNKSLAEATLSHLAAIPKGKAPIEMVARRKHQITYLATVAVAREEQLAEQWSQNRHMKRVSAQKYGF
uniref:Proline-rich protein PRCC n=1 Tax=Ascaris lumbricoides TaxID=6252 RepID=A0A0M3I2F3_ASCLU